MPLSDLMENQMPAFDPVTLIDRPPSADADKNRADFLAGRGCHVLLERDTAELNGVEGYPKVEFADIGTRAKLAVVLGGDGSMLSAARQIAAHRVPLVGVNQGRLGFMTDIAQKRMLESVGELIDGRFSVEDRTMLAAEVRRGSDTLVS